MHLFPSTIGLIVSSTYHHQTSYSFACPSRSSTKSDALPLFGDLSSNYNRIALKPSAHRCSLHTMTKPGLITPLLHQGEGTSENNFIDGLPKNDDACTRARRGQLRNSPTCTLHAALHPRVIPYYLQLVESATAFPLHVVVCTTDCT